MMGMLDAGHLVIPVGQFTNDFICK